jgi:hypothetical protein
VAPELDEQRGSDISFIRATTVVPNPRPALGTSYHLEQIVIEINGVAHIVLAVSEWDQCKYFYEALFPFLGLKRAFDGQD